MNGVYKVRKQVDVLFPNIVQIELYGEIKAKDANFLKVNLMSSLGIDSFDVFSVEDTEFKAIVRRKLENGPKEMETILRDLNKLTFITNMMVYVIPEDVDLLEILMKCKEEVKNEFTKLYEKEVTTINTKVHKLNFHKVHGLYMYNYSGELLSLTHQFYKGIKKDKYKIDVTIDFEVC